ncbi:MAG: copper chaperone PCu(A)C [bacterium]
MTTFAHFAKTGFITVLLLFIAACSGKDEATDTKSTTADGITITQAWLRSAAPPTRTTGGYMVIINNGTTGDRLIGVSSTVAEHTEMHQSLKDEDGTMLMRKARTIEVPAGGSVQFEKGGYHIMFIGLDKPIKAGTTYDITLTFENAGDIVVPMKAKAE